MSSRKTVAAVLAGAATTAVLGVLTVVLVPVLGFVTAEVVGTWVPRWAFAAPPMLSVVAGGSTAGFLARTDRRACALLGGLAGALGATGVGVGVGLVGLVVALGFTPAHAGDPTLSGGALAAATVGGGAGFAVGATVGALGGVVGHAGRRGRRR
ncbi:hypothetical protein SAMN04487947_2208 [Halogeometricum rufum]|uniref:Uncharacterized protein n=1 Tax=Halogeometricum rufum TaxID=553469 RepID=A0A1I6HLL2_9EURY|nr:hypothetical protein [Halogeometricum rufum]SFR55335.1 hypothetical protein SAMN04487947_2208 [Halogeometricum rufum]